MIRVRLIETFLVACEILKELQYHFHGGIKNPERDVSRYTFEDVWHIRKRYAKYENRLKWLLYTTQKKIGNTFHSLKIGLFLNRCYSVKNHRREKIKKAF